ncbi:aminobenzoyl-glutamate utilization protein B [Micromonospora pattaloongensis]|uniref:Aminobenzoyl-glutamate utilization protein B n=1 Tax=Micromonospora pattaloongensis TaxID=405436 RepID=A0A1H3RW65_9ACTN|nr:amidohydrolase [Micromonospora pattaloongensis]SDZ29880.1 aminobenzoyl-glutamate utilization protein B [Micromonospora pattaloongensis]
MCETDHLDSSGVSRRDMLALLGAAGASLAVAPVLTADPAMAAASDLALDPATQPADPVNYEPPANLAVDSQAKDAAIAWIDRNSEGIVGLNDRIWEFAEPSLAEWNSSWAEAQYLKANGFTIEWGAGGMPTAFVATFSNGTGKPVIGFSGEYDALPGLSQEKGNPRHSPLVYNHDPYAPTYGFGHGCGHNALGAAAAGAAAATAAAMRARNLDGTIKFFGSTAEEQLVGKSVAVKAGVYRGLDAFVDWHPSSGNSTSWGSSNAMYSYSFHFLGTDGHGGAPLATRATQDAVSAMSMLTEYLRESHQAHTARVHYAIRQTGQAPNVFPTLSSIWYFAREGSPTRAKILMDRIVRCAEAAAMATGTRMQHRMMAGVWNTLGNKRGAELMHANMTQIGAPTFSAADHGFGRELQRSNGAEETGFSEKISPLTPPAAVFMGGGSTDVADISWQVPTISMGTAHQPAGTKNHSWHHTATAAAHSGHVATVIAAKYLAATTVDLLTQPTVVAEMKEEFHRRTSKIKWKSLLPDNYELPLYEPPKWFLERTGQKWPPRGVKWPPRRVVSTETAPDLGPALPPQNLPPLE